MRVIYLGERGSPHVETLAGIAVGYDEDGDLRVVSTVKELSPLELNTIADRLEQQAAHLRAGQRHAPQ
jgi:hypothetical protein